MPTPSPQCWLSVLPPVVQLWSSNSDMEACFIWVGSSIYLKHSLHWQNHMFSYFKKYKERKRVSQFNELSHYIVRQRQVCECKGMGNRVDEMTGGRWKGIRVKKGKKSNRIHEEDDKRRKHKILWSQALYIWHSSQECGGSISPEHAVSSVNWAPQLPSRLSHTHLSPLLPTPPSTHKSLCLFAPGLKVESGCQCSEKLLQKEKLHVFSKYSLE